MNKARQAQRVKLTCEVDFRRHGDALFVVDLFDLSPQGCCISPPVRVYPGESVWIRVPGMEAIHAEVAWVEEWRVGLEFDRAFHPAVFDHVVARLSAPPPASAS